MRHGRIREPMYDTPQQSNTGTMHPSQTSNRCDRGLAGTPAGVIGRKIALSHASLAATQSGGVGRRAWQLLKTRS